MYKNIMHSVMCRYSISMYTLALVQYIFCTNVTPLTKWVCLLSAKQDRIQKLSRCGSTVFRLEKEEMCLIDKSDAYKTGLDTKVDRMQEDSHLEEWCLMDESDCSQVNITWKC